MKLLLLAFISTFFLMTSGCTVHSTKGKEFSEMYTEKPVAILVVPAINQSTAADAPLLYSSTINEPLSNAGYYVLPIEVTDAFLRNEGLSTGESLKDIPPQKFAKTFGADAALYVTIKTWNSNYAITAANVTVETSYVMKSCKTGATLWSFQDRVVVNTGSDGGGNIIAAIIATAIATSLQDYVPIASKINIMALNTVPYGKYSKYHNKDMNQKVDVGKISTK